MLILLLSLLLLAGHSEAHLKLFYSPFRLPIRNAPGPTSDGLFSAQTNQPCGGQNDWGRNNQRRYATQIVDGQTVCARVNWNGGHATTTNENRLKVVFTCGRPTIARTFLNLPALSLVNGTFPEPDEPFSQFLLAPETNKVYDGYTLCVDLPYQDIQWWEDRESTRRQCSLSVMEGNGWGGCHDILLRSRYDANGTENAPYDMLRIARATTLNSTAGVVVGEPPSKDVDILQRSQGTYRVENCLTDTGGRCCLMGFFGVMNNGAVSARLMGSGGQSVCFDLSYYGYRDYQMILRPSKFDPTLFVANFYLDMGYDEYGRPVSQQNMSISMRDGGSLVINNVGLDIPEVSDHDAVYFSTLDNGVTLTYIPMPNYSTVPDYIPWGYICAGVFGGAFLIWLVGGWIVNCREGGPCCRHPHIYALLVNLGCVRKSNRRANAATSPEEEKFTVQLPPNWFSAVDNTSGEVYYFNTVTKETKWERPSFVV